MTPLILKGIIEILIGIILVGYALYRANKIVKAKKENPGTFLLSAGLSVFGGVLIGLGIWSFFEYIILY